MTSQYGKPVKSILFVSLIAAMVLPFVVADFAYAGVSPETMANAERGAEIWYELQEEKANQIHDVDKIQQLEKEFKQIRYELNKVGVATAQQYEDNPTYWRSLSHPPFPDELHGHEVHQAPYVENTSQNCNTCPQKGYFVAGYDWWIIPYIWKTSESADSWAAVSQVLTDYVSQVLTDQDHAQIQPWSHYALKKPGSIEWYTSHKVTDNNYEAIQKSNLFEFQSTYVKPSYAEVTHPWISDVPKNSAHRVTAGTYNMN